MSKNIILIKNISLWKIKNLISSYIGLPKAVFFLFLCRFINGLGFFVFTFLTLFLTKNLSLSANKVGLYLMFVEFGRLIGSLIGGILADIFGRKIILLVFTFMWAFSLFPCAFLGNSLIIPIILIFVAFFDGVTRPVYDALAADLSNSGNRKVIFSFIYLGLNLGVGVGNLMAGFLFDHYMHILFLGSAVAILIAYLFIYQFVLETLPYEIRLKNKNHVSIKKESLLATLIKRPVILYFLLAFILYFIVFSQLSFSLPLQINDIFGQTGPRFFGIIMSFNCFHIVFMTVPITVISQKYRPILNLFFAGIFYAVGFGMLYWVNHFNWLLLSTLIWTTGEILTFTNARVYISNQSPSTHQGRFNSLLTIGESISRIIGPPMWGLVIVYLSIRQVWIFSFAIAIIAAGMVYTIYFSEKKYHSLETK